MKRASTFLPGIFHKDRRKPVGGFTPTPNEQKRQGRDKKSILVMVGGFTLIEMLFILAVVIILSALAIIYGRSGESQIALFKEETRIVNIIFRAKSLAISTLGGGTGVPCGYGVHFYEGDQFLLFKDIPPPSSDCSQSSHLFRDSSEIVDSYNLDPQITFLDLSRLSDIVFIPPDPTVVISPGPADRATIELGTKDGKNSGIIKVTTAGEITVQ